MKNIFYIITFFSIILGQIESNKIGFFHKQIRSHFGNGTIEEILPEVLEWLEDKEICPEGSYNELYLKIWEIKGYFYIGEIEKSIEKQNELKEKIDATDYGNLLFDMPFFKYIDNPNKKETCIVKKILSTSMTSFWNLEILSPNQFYNHFSDLHLMVGVNNDEYTISPGLHDSSMQIIDKNGNDVNYSIFPPLIDFDKDKLEDYDVDSILDYEFRIAKQARIKLLQKQTQKVIEFKHQSKPDIYVCNVIGLPLVESSIMPFYKLYIHDNKNVDRYSFKLKRQNSSNYKSDFILLNWNNKNWEMQESFSKNKVEISIPDSFTKKNKDGQASFRISSEGNPVALSDTKEKGFIIKKGEEGLNKKWAIDKEEYNLIDYNLVSSDTENGDIIKVQSVEIDMGEIGKTVNIEVTDDFYSDPKKEKQLRRWTTAFYISIAFALTILFIN